MANDSHKTLIALSTAAMTLFNSTQIHANSVDEKTFIDYRYSHYGEADLAEENLGNSGSVQRYDIKVHQFLLRTPISNDTQLSVSVSTESMTGASPWYVESDADGNPVQVMSGATIEEKRDDANISFKTFSKNSDFTISAGISVEKDYSSINTGVGSSHTFNNKSSTIEWGIGGTADYIEPTDFKDYEFSSAPRPEKESKRSGTALLGFTQIINKNTLVNTSLTYAIYKGYLSDPYKRAEIGVDENKYRVSDSRPETKSQVAWGVAGRHFVNKLKGAAQADYRYYYNNWGIESHTVDLAWHQNFGPHLQIKPAIRYYNQSAALFYRHYYIEERNDGFYSSDYRLSNFEAISLKLTASTTINYGSMSLPLSLTYESYQSDGDNPGLVDFSFISLGTGIRF